MRSASRLFYLSIFALWVTPGQCNAQDDCAISPKAIVNDACASYADLDSLNNRVKPAIDELTQTTDFFSHYRLNLFHKKCPFWDDESGMCGNIACAVETLDDEEDIPEVWRSSELGKLEGPLAKHPGRSGRKEVNQKPLHGGLGEDVDEDCVFEIDDECDERDYCVPEDESASSKGDYVSLLRNPERFTGYAGVGAAQVWDAIYRENCFQTSSFPQAAALDQSQSSSSSFASSPLGGSAGVAAEDFKLVLEAAGRQQNLEHMRETHPNALFVANTGFEAQDECLEKRVFYRVISGMHASISTHLCWEFLNQTTGEWQPNLSCYVSRLHTHPDRISNLYFNYALVTRAVAKLGPFLRGSVAPDGSDDSEYTFCTGDNSEDAATRAKVLAVTEGASSVPNIFDESLMFKDGEGPSLKEDFRNRFRNVSRLMDCVGCDKCRLWGKLQTAGYGTALKVLFEFGDEDLADDVPTLKRTELVALFNTYARVSSSLAALREFHAMVESGDEAGAPVASSATGASADGSPVSDPGASTLPVDRDGELDRVVDADSSRHEEIDPSDGGTAGDDSCAGEQEEEEEGKESTCPAKKKPKKDTSLRASFDREWRRFRNAYSIALGHWIRFPITFYKIVRIETMRLIQFWLGLPIHPRTWKFEKPNLDEL